MPATAHGEDRLANDAAAAWLKQEVDTTVARGRSYRQTRNAATAYVDEFESGRFNVVVLNDNGEVVTVRKKLYRSGVDRLARSFGWTN